MLFTLPGQKGERHYWYQACIAAFALHAGPLVGLLIWNTADGARGVDVAVIEMAFAPPAIANESPTPPAVGPAAVESLLPQPNESLPDSSVVERLPLSDAIEIETPLTVSEMGQFRPPPMPSRQAPQPAEGEAEVHEPVVSTLRPEVVRDDQGGLATSPAQESAKPAPGVYAEYTALLRAWLERHRRYPYIAKIRNEQGTAMISFEIDRNGRVLKTQLVQSTGHPMLDREVSRMIERAAPLPRVPEQMPGARLKFALPITFRLD